MLGCALYIRKCVPLAKEIEIKIKNKLNTSIIKMRKGLIITLYVILGCLVVLLPSMLTRKLMMSPSRTSQSNSTSAAEVKTTEYRPTTPISSRQTKVCSQSSQAACSHPASSALSRLVRDTASTHGAFRSSYSGCTRTSLMQFQFRNS